MVSLLAEQHETDLRVSHRGPLGSDDLADVIRAYNEVTERLQRSHDSLIAEVVRLRRELAGADAQIQRSKRLAALGEMAAGIAHEIRNPLAAIQLYVAVLQEDLPRDTPGAAIAGKVAVAVRGLEAIVCDVLSFARELKPRHRLLDVEATLRRVVEAHAPAIAAGGVEVNFDLPESQPALIADADLLHQALLNLVRNSVDAMVSGGGRLTLGVHADGATVVFTVRDTGPGIAESDIDRIFNPFFTTRSTGTGLGLAIVHRIVDVHGGTICVHNNNGAVFQLALPATPSPETTPATTPSAARPPESEPVHS